VASADDVRTGPIASFGPFRIYPTQRRLERNDDAIVIGSRSLEILIALVERAGEILSQRELIARVWPDVVVEATNLRVHILGLRRALGDGTDDVRYVANVPGRGYCFVAPVQWVGVAPRPLSATDSVDRQRAAHGLPPRPRRMIGCAETVVELSALLKSHRFVSVVGAGGMGKTTVAVAVGYALLDGFENAVFFVDLSALTDAALVPFAIGSALGCPVQAPDPTGGVLASSLSSIADCRRRRRGIRTSLRRSAAGLCSRCEALRVEGEHVLGPL